MADHLDEGTCTRRTDPSSDLGLITGDSAGQRAFAADTGTVSGARVPLHHRTNPEAESAPAGDAGHRVDGPTTGTRSLESTAAGYCPPGAHTEAVTCEITGRPSRRRATIGQLSAPKKPST
jgi:hypothetical protein